MATIETLYRIVAGVSGGNAVKGLADAIKGVSTAGENARRSVNQFGNTLKGLAYAEATRMLVGFVDKSIDLADHMNDLRQKLGVNVEALGQFKVAAENSGISLDTVAGGLNKLNRNLVDARDGTGATAIALKTMGIALNDANGNLKKADQVTLEIADRFQDFHDGPQKAALAMAVFGKSGADLIPMLNMGSEEIKKYGLVIDQEFASAADAFNDKVGLMKAGVTQFGLDTAKVLLPALSDAMDAFSGLFGTGEDWKIFGDIVSDVLRGIVVAVSALVTGIKETIAAIKLLGSVASAIAFEDADQMDAKIATAWDDFMKKSDANAKSFNDIITRNVDSSNAFGDGGASQRLRVDINGSGGRSRNPFSGSMAGYNPSGAAKEAADAEKLNKELEKKLLLLATDTNSIGMNNAAKEKAKILAEFEAKGLSKSSEGYERLSAAIDANTAAHRSFKAGATEALNEYVDTATNAAAQTKNLFTDAFKGMEDALVEFVTTGKLNFSNFANSIIKDIARIVIQRTILGPLADMVGGFFGGGTGISAAAARGAANPALFGPGFAAGGDHVGGLRIVGENGPELEATGPSRIFNAEQTRRIMGAGGQQNNVSVTVNMAEGSASTSSDGKQAAALGNMIASTVKRMLIDEKRPGGLLAAI